jgi:heat-inducible transcriptional repressor
MRALNQDELEQRKRKVLQFVVHEYVRTGKPVGSSAIAQAGRLGLSPATIRNVLADLEKDGMINHPHTSAGRVPTDKGYRLYVDSLVELQRLAIQEQARIHEEYETRTRQIEDLMTQTSRMLSSISHYTGFVMAPKLDRNNFSHLELVPLEPGRILVAMVTESGMSKHFTISTELEIPREQLRTISRMINQNFAGRPLQEVKSGIIEKLDNLQQGYRDVISLAREIGEEIQKVSSAADIYLEGTSNILALPDFSRADELHDLFKIIEEKQMLSNLLESGLQPPSARKPSGAYKVSVRIGSENQVKALENLSVISSTYHLGDNTVGVLGILGPKRMEYSKMIALVDYVSQIVNKFVKDFENK